ncbi:MAG: carboxypeptidase regulatory-like domain-containing protein, partial [Clostridia bacterium]|nr:carboxypeptidase regulatory-like domain-containing protein [Clostridia bacterium]
MKKLKRGKVIAASLIAVLLIALVAIIKIASIDKYAGLVKVNNASLSSISTKLSANISDLSEDNNITVKGYDEIDYNISYTLSDYTGDRDVIINAKLDDNERYASFKEVTGNNIASVLSSNRKEITITISNLPSGQTINSKVTMIIENAPNGYEVRPTVRIKESTGVDYTNITVKPVTVNTSSLIGSVIDEDGNIVPNILISLKKNNDIIKETYTSSEGKYTFSDITPDTYSVVVNEENYENLELNNIYIENGNMLNLIVKKVYPYKIETNKYITKVELSNLGSSKDYIYNDVKLANIPVKKVNDLHGKIYYKITVQNTGEKAGIIAAVKDELPEGLSFDESLNSGYELKNGIIYNRNLEGVELSAGEMISDTLVLTIENTDVAKTYINKVNAKGELYEHVVYLIDGRTYKTLDVLEGETIDEPTVSIANFNGWYTDEKLTNKYKFE